jgi:hypothetical protein
LGPLRLDVIAEDFKRGQVGDDGDVPLLNDLPSDLYQLLQVPRNVSTDGVGDIHPFRSLLMGRT